MHSLKQDLRAAAVGRRAALDAGQRAALSAAICDRVLTHLEPLDSRGVLVYAAMRDEVDPAGATAAMMGAGIPVAYPLIDWTTRSLRPIHLTATSVLQPGRFGVPEPPETHREPFDPGQVTVVLVPGLAFDTRGYRLGYGAGMYDRLLEELPSTALRWGLAFEAQVVERVPSEAHDQRLDAVVTEARWIVTEARDG